MVAGLALLLVGAEMLIGAGSRLARRLGVPPLLVGLTVVSIGTSIPELAVGVGAAREGTPGLAVGNIAGTNLVNILCILGLSALISPVIFARRTLRFEVPAMIVAVLTFYLLAVDGHLGRLDGVVLTAGALLYTGIAVRNGRQAAAEALPLSAEEQDRVAAIPIGRNTALLVLSMAVIIGGAEMLVHGAADIARSLGISDAVIGLTVVAIGTSAPELVTTIVSTLRGDRDIAIGNLIGSSVYNIVLVLGLTVLVVPGGIEVSSELLNADLLLLVAATLACAPVFVMGARISRLEGGLFVASYAGYLTWLLTTRI
ncbi:MAG: calcium/sodium antiporter [Nocardioides sp.]